MQSKIILNKIVKRILIVANTYYQLILSVQLKTTLFKYESVILLLSDHSRGAEEKSKKLQGVGIFEEVAFLRSKEIVYKNKSIVDKANILIENTFAKKSRYSFYLEGIDDLWFDELIFYNYGADMYGLFAILTKRNQNLKVSLMEEGLLSYNVDFVNNNMRISDFSRKILHKRTMEQSLYSFYCYYPCLYTGNLNTIKVPQITPNSESAKMISTIFETDKIKEKYQQQYIFFTSVYDFEGGKRVGEFELVSRVAKLVGRENLLIKTHPRDERTIYIDNGFMVDKNSSIPWEAIQLTRDFSNKKFMTINSGSVLSGSTMSQYPVSTFYMYKLCDIEGNKSCIENAREIEKLINQDGEDDMFKKVKIAETIEDILL